MSELIGQVWPTMQAGFHTAMIAATSWMAWRVYAAAGGSVLLVLSLWIAKRQRADITQLSFLGRIPTRKAKIDERLQKIDAFNKGRTRKTLKCLCLVLLFGFVVPSAILSLGLYYYPWFRPGAVTLLVPDCGRGAAVQPGLIDSALFVLGQLAMGVAGIADTVLTSGTRRFAQFGYIPGDQVVSVAVMGFRYFVAMFAGVFSQLLVAGVLARSDRRLKHMREVLQQRRDNAAD